MAMSAPANLAPSEPLQELAQHPLLADPRAAAQARAFANHALAEGVRCRQRGELGRAYLYYRFALCATFLRGPDEGLAATTANIFMLRSLLRDVVVRANVSERDLKQDADAEWLRAFRASIDETLQRMQDDARHLLSLVDARASEAALACAHAAQQIAICADDLAARRRWHAATVESAAALGDHEEALVSTLEELEQSREIEACGIALTEELGREQLGFERVWQSYLAHRGALDGPLRSTEVVERLDAAFRHFEHLRFVLTKNGGPIAHIFSFGLSQRIQMLGRDLIRVHVLRRRDPNASLAIAERMKARALGDLMSREHYVPIDRAPAWFRSRLVEASGNVQSIEPATLADVAGSVYGSGATLLVFVKLEDVFVGWRLLPNGDLSAWTFEPPRDALDGIFSALPYVAEGEHAAPDDERRTEPEVLEGHLSSLWQQLIPEEYEPSLAGCTRLTIVPDAELEYIPFAALRMRDGRHVVEAFETLYWPSVTAALATESDHAARVALQSADLVPYYQGGNLVITHSDAIVAAQGRRDGVYQRRGVVLGDPDLSCRSGEPPDLPALPGARTEAERVAARLGVTARVGPDATLDALWEQAHGARVVHIAAHASADATDPARSLLVLADGDVSARELYDAGFGLRGAHCRAGLVVLSACQTGLGVLHPDSVINLANGFLIAGANAVVATLWSINDDSSLRLMERFYELLAAGEDADKRRFSVPAALRIAQLERLRDERDRHPLCWAAYKATGSPRNPLAM
jgi:CHAT domain-containing protein